MIEGDIVHHCVTAVRGNYEGSGLYIVGSSRGERGLPSLDYLLLQIWTLLFSLFQGRKPHMSLMLNNEHMRMGICHHCWLSLMIGSNWIGIKNQNLEKIRFENTDKTCIVSADSCCLFTDDGGGPK